MCFFNVSINQSIVSLLGSLGAALSCGYINKIMLTMPTLESRELIAQVIVQREY
jgi:hypothetical protein